MDFCGVNKIKGLENSMEMEKSAAKGLSIYLHACSFCHTADQGPEES